ncbi:hypothetical protein [Mycobacterium arosiense]|uniref:hypothetical protein n=1 Tax=Mycobacterium arosiense TaxID=425468 RepID=UPI00114FF0EE|nr:hypothetical protein [Mycobacterium arosiense]
MHDFTASPKVVASARDAYQWASVTDPRSQLAIAEIYVCFAPVSFASMVAGARCTASGAHNLGPCR